MSRRPNPSNINRHSWRPTDSQLDAIFAHQFKDENFSELCNRLIHYLAQEIEAGRAGIYEIPPDFIGSGSTAKSFRGDAIAAQLLKDYFQGSDQATWAYILGWASSLPKILPIRSMDEAYACIKPPQPITRILAADAKALLMQRCSDKTAREYLWGLHKSGVIRLVHHESSTGVALGKPKGTYKFIDFPE
ncbi:MAG: hypothetical protein QNJ46_07980 [Leptolyngbyaceae cyanobacterium MO_188.B28]|nr:hypothetical protein [Leptolyngbyaceae cyanobacterium MO_188.B28]